MPLINFKTELKLKWTKHCIFSAVVSHNTDVNPSDIIFIIKDTKIWAFFLALSARDNQKLSKLLSNGFERSVYWNKYKTKHENKNTANEYRYFLELKFFGVNSLFVLVYQMKMTMLIDLKLEDIIYQKE